MRSSFPLPCRGSLGGSEIYYVSEMILIPCFDLPRAGIIGVCSHTDVV